MNYQAFLTGLNSVIAPLGIKVQGGVLTDGETQYGVTYSIQGVISALLNYFYVSGEKYASVNDMLSDLLKLTDGSNAYYIKQLINNFKQTYRYHYKVKVSTAGSISFSTTGKGLTSFTFNSDSYTLAPGDELFLAVPSIAVGTYDLYVYSTSKDESLSFETSNCTISYLEYEHCISYVFTSTDYGFVYCKPEFGSVQKVEGDATIDITQSGQLIKLHSDRDGQYLVYIYCELEDENLIVTEAASGCSLGSRSVRW